MNDHITNNFFMVFLPVIMYTYDEEYRRNASMEDKEKLIQFMNFAVVCYWYNVLKK